MALRLAGVPYAAAAVRDRCEFTSRQSSILLNASFFWAGLLGRENDRGNDSAAIAAATSARAFKMY
jgi:hypothetical protein